MEDQVYFPPSESKGGWRRLNTAEEVSVLAGMNPEKLALIQRKQQRLNNGSAWTLSIVRHGYLVGEYCSLDSARHIKYNVCSCSKSFTGMAWGVLFEDSRQGKLTGAQVVEPDSLAYDFLPQGHPLTDPRKARIKIIHLLGMTSGLPGENTGRWGILESERGGPYEYALGLGPNREGMWANTLVAEPGEVWDYCDSGYAHLSLIFKNITGREMKDYLWERVLSPIGIEGADWNHMGGGGWIGPHTEPHSGVYITSGELARFGYLALHRGRWGKVKLVQEWWIDLSTQSTIHPDYGHSWWVNRSQTTWPYLPADTFAAMGYYSNKCYVIPSLDLVVARVGTGPISWEEKNLIGDIVGAIQV